MLVFFIGNSWLILGIVKTQGFFRIHDNKNVTFTAWGDGEPNWPAEKCAAMQTSPKVKPFLSLVQSEDTTFY